MRRIADEVRNSIDFHVMQDGAATVEHAVLAGPAVAIPGFAEQLGEEIGLPLEVGNISEADRADSAASTPAASRSPPVWRSRRSRHEGRKPHPD